MAWLVASDHRCVRCVVSAIVLLLAASASGEQPASVPRVDLYGDPLPEGAIARLGSRRFRAPAGGKLLYEPGDRALINVGPDEFIRVWELPSGRLRVATRMRQIDPRPLRIRPADAVLQPDGRNLRVLWTDALVQTYDTTNYRLQDEWTGQAGTGPLEAQAISADGARLATVHEGLLRIWDIAARKEIAAFAHLFRIKEVRTIALAPDGSTVAIGTTRVIPWNGPDEAVPRGRTDQGGLQIWDVATQRLLGEYVPEPRDGMDTLFFSPRGTRIVCGCHEIHLCEATSARHLRDVDAYPHAAVSADDKLLAAVDRGGALCVWELANGDVLRRFDCQSEHTGPPTFRADAVVIAARQSSDGRAQVLQEWRLGDGCALHLVPGHRGQIYAAAVTPDGNRIAAGGGDRVVRVWQAATGRETQTLARQHSDIIAVFFLDGGNTVFSAARDGTIIAWNSDSGAEVRRWPAEGEINCAATSPDGSTIAFVRTAESAHGRRSGRIEFRRWPDGKILGTAATVPTTAVTFTNDGKRLVAGGWKSPLGALNAGIRPDRADGPCSNLRLFDVETLRETELLPEHPRPVGSVCFSRDNHFFVCASCDMVRVSETSSWKRLYSIDLEPQHALFIWRSFVAASPSGSLVAIAGSDGVRLWQPRRDIETIMDDGAGFFASELRSTEVLFPADGWFTTASEEGTLLIWKAHEPAK